MASAPRQDYLPAEYRSGPYYLSEAGSALISLPPPSLPPPPRRRLGLGPRLCLWLLAAGLGTALALTGLEARQRAHAARAHLTQTALLLREMVLAAPLPSCQAAAAQQPRLQRAAQRGGCEIALYTGETQLAASAPDLLPRLPGEWVLHLLEGDGSRPVVHGVTRRHREYQVAAVRVPAPGDCSRLLLLVAAPADEAGALAALFATRLLCALALLLPLGLLPLRLSRQMARLHRRVNEWSADRAPAGVGATSRSDSRPQAATARTGATRTDEQAPRLLRTDDPLLRRGDELGDLGRAFAQITETMRDSEARLGARVRELTTLHAIGRAISSVLDLEEALRKIVSEVVAVFSARRGALVLLRTDMRPYLGAGVRIDAAAADAVAALGEALIRRCAAMQARGGVRIDDLSRDPELSAPARHGGLSGSLMAVPLDQQGRVLGILLITRSRGRQRFTDSDLQLLATVADQASTAISNARLYDEVQRSSEDLELRVKERTYDLVMANQELARVVDSLHQAQAQLVLSERLAGLGQLVAGVAHEVNSPAGAIKGAADALHENVVRMGERGRQLAELGLPAEARARFLALCDEVAARLPGGTLLAPAQLRRLARDYAAVLARESGIGEEACLDAGRTLAELGLVIDLDEDAGVLHTLAGLAAHQPGALDVLVGYLEQEAYLHRNAHAIRTAIGQITRIVGALKSYSHLDRARVELTDVHEGLETTLIILHSELKYGIILTRKYGTVPAIPAYVDELNQVWTNLLHNAVQALNQQDPGRPKEIIIETGHSAPTQSAPLVTAAAQPRPATGAHLGVPSTPGVSVLRDGTLVVAPARTEAGPHPGPSGGEVWVAIEDNGPGIPPDVLPRIFDPFFTTKQKGEGTGIGLGIVRQIVSRHHGRIEVSSVPGRTRFTVWLPASGPAGAQG